MGPKDDSCMIFEGDSSFKKVEKIAKEVQKEEGNGHLARQIIYEQKSETDERDLTNSQINIDQS